MQRAAGDSLHPLSLDGSRRIRIEALVANRRLCDPLFGDISGFLLLDFDEENRKDRGRVTR